MKNKIIKQSAVEYYVDNAKVLHIFVNGHKIVTIGDVKGTEEYVAWLVDDVLYSMGYTYKD